MDTRARYKGPQPSTLNPQPSTLNPQMGQVTRALRYKDLGQKLTEFEIFASPKYHHDGKDENDDQGLWGRTKRVLSTTLRKRTLLF